MLRLLRLIEISKGATVMAVEFISRSGARAGEPNAYEVVWPEGRILLDCGAGTGEPLYLSKLSRPDLVWISHAHGDHCGGLLKLKERFPQTGVIATVTTRRMLGPMLAPGSGGYDQGRVGALVRQIEGIEEGRFTSVGGLPGVRVMALPGGHVPGAAMLLMEIEVGAGAGEKKRLLYTGDFCTHDQATVEGAGAPVLKEGTRVDVVVMEAMLGTDREADCWEVGEARRGLEQCVEEAPGAVLFGVSSLGEAQEMAMIASGRRKVMVDEYLKPVIEKGIEAKRESTGQIEFGNRRQLKERLEVGGVVIAPGDQYQRGTAAAWLAGGLLDEEEATVVVLNRARKKTGAGRLVGTTRGARLKWWDREVELRARVVHHRWINHAPRWQLVGFAKLLQARKILLVHGSTGARWAVKRAMEEAGVESEIVVVTNQEPIRW